jgi:putative Holliday junction resolvase
MRILCLDVGEKTIGVAVSDLLFLTAQGVEVIRRTSLEKDYNRLGEIITQYEVETIVIGLPKNMNGTIGPKGEAMKEFADHLQEKFSSTKVKLWDERLSTVAATRALISADVSRAKRKKVIDKMAAMFILQGYLDSLS